MKQVLLAVIIIACFSSAVLAGLTRVYVIVNMADSPIEIVDFGGYIGEEEDRISSVVQYKNRTERDVEAVAISMVYYDPFNDKKDGVKCIATNILGRHVEFRGMWSIYGDPSFIKTAIAFVSAVRFVDGEVWKADIEKVIETAGDMPELSFLSRTEMLEIEKE